MTNTLNSGEGGSGWTMRIFTDKQKNKRKMTSICFVVFEATYTEWFFLLTLRKY